jgi:hypothetical protein
MQQPSRREALRAGALGLSGLALPDLFRQEARARNGTATAGAGTAKACILIFMWGGPSQLETWDLKPGAPEDIRGEFKPIATSVPGVQISEHFPLLAQQMHRIALVRSMSHDDPAHLSTAHRILTGHLAPKPKSDAIGPSPRDWPHLGSIVAKVRPAAGALPTAVTMPWTVAHPAAPGGQAPGQHAGWLGKAYDPFRVDGNPNDPGFQVAGLGLPEGVSPERMADRRGLRQVLGSPFEIPSDAPRAWDGFQERALDALASAEARGAFRLDGEDPRVRDLYGRNIHGQCLLMARRLVEAGVRLVTVNWHNDGRNFWDTHVNNFRELKNRLMPPADRGFAALLDDLDARGMLDETLVVWVGEFGRMPRINRANSGREHWPRCYSAALAGGGVRGGVVHGASDRWASYPTRDPVSPEDLAATMLQALGVPPDTELRDAEGRPLRANDGTPLRSLFG